MSPGEGDGEQWQEQFPEISEAFQEEMEFVLHFKAQESG